MDTERSDALLLSLRELSASLRSEEVAARLLDAVLRAGGALGAVLSLEDGAAQGVADRARGETAGEPTHGFELRAHGASLGRLHVYGSSAGDAPALAALAAQGSIALANARAHEAAVRRAECDPLTGLANHGRIWEALEREAARAQRYGRALSFVMLDLDRFKALNDRDGHLAGDAALVHVAALVRERSRASDTAGRYGGDELALVLPETPREGAIAVAEKIRAATEDLRHGASGATLTLSAGVASAPADGKTAADLVHAADARLYRAKAAGGNRVAADRADAPA